MKVLLLLLTLTMTAQPLQAGFCDMEANQGTDIHTMNMEHDADTMSDCCEADETDSPVDCQMMAGCGSCSAVASALLDVSMMICPWLASHDGSFLSALITPDHSSPPYHPPIS